MAKGREAVGFHESNCKNQEFDNLSLHWRPKSKGRRNLTCLHGSIFLSRRWTLKGSLDWMGMEIQTMDKRLSIFFIEKLNIEKI